MNVISYDYPIDNAMTSLRAIMLSATESNWRLFMLRKSDSAFLAFQQAVWWRDDYTCQFCAFRAVDYLEVVNVDGNYLNNRLDNLVTACGFCTQCFFLESIGKGTFGGGSLIYCPELTQGELNALCHVLFVAMINGFACTLQARNLYRSFKLRHQIVEKEWGEGLSNPALLGCLLVDLPHHNVDTFKGEALTKLRLLPDMVRFKTEIEHWSRAALTELIFS